MTNILVHNIVPKNTLDAQSERFTFNSFQQISSIGLSKDELEILFLCDKKIESDDEDINIYKELKSYLTQSAGYKNEVRSLMVKIDDLTKENDNLNKENDKLKRENESLNKENDKLKKENENLNKENDKLKKENDNLNKENDKLKRENENLNKENDNLNKENDNLNKENDNLNKKNDKLKKDNKSLNKENDDLKKENKKIQLSNEEILLKEENATKQNEELSASILQLKQKIQDLEDQNKKQNSFHLLDHSEYEKLNIIKEIGRGATSSIYKVSRIQYLALKVLHPNFSDPTNEEEEINEISSFIFENAKKLSLEYEILNQINHPNIIKVYGFYIGDKKNMPSILIELCPTSLKQCIKKLNDEEKINIIIEISFAMKAIHSLKIIHRDLKISNILLDSNHHVKLCDFGICKLFKSDDRSVTFSQIDGTIKYMAPELIQEKGDYDEKIDVYAFGVVVYQILMNGEFPRISVADVGAGKMAPIPSCISSFSSDLIKKCWSCNPSDRPSFDSIHELLIQNKKSIINSDDE